jgi:hypothetical protein
MMLGKPLASTKITIATTGKDPVLTTVSGTYQYSLNSTNTTMPSGTECLFVDKVYTDDYDEAVDVDDTPCEKINGDYSNPAKVIFFDNPGADTYYVRCFKKPKDISSESIEMDVRQEWHLKGIYEGVMGWIEKTENGKSDRWDNFIYKILPEFWAEENKSIITGVQRKRYDGGY